MNDREAALLARARRGLTPAPGDAARVRVALEASLQGSLPRERVSPAERARASEAPWRLARVGAALALAVASGAGGYVLGYRAGRNVPVAPAPTSVPVPVAPPTMRESVDAPAPLHPLPELPAPPPRARPSGEASRVAATPSAGPSIGVAASASGESSLELETRLLARVERALRDDNPRLALGLLGELEREVPGGQLEEERRAARVIAHCKLGTEFAPKLAEEFSASYASSAYRERIRAACAAATSDE